MDTRSAVYKNSQRVFDDQKFTTGFVKPVVNSVLWVVFKAAVRSGPWPGGPHILTGVTLGDAPRGKFCGHQFCSL